MGLKFQAFNSKISGPYDYTIPSKTQSHKTLAVLQAEAAVVILNPFLDLSTTVGLKELDP